LRVALLGGVFAVLFSTTTSRELGLALETGVGWVRLPYRYAFSISLAVSSLGLLDEEWQAIREAQTARGVVLNLRGLRQLWQQAGDLVAFTVPAIVLTTRRAWNATAAAYARGFDSPQRKPYHTLSFHRLDALLLVLCLCGMFALFAWEVL
jgi:energy-coupling factor transport system permease protein